MRRRPPIGTAPLVPNSFRSEGPAGVVTRTRLHALPPGLEIRKIARNRAAHALVVRKMRYERDVGEAEGPDEELASLEFALEEGEMVEQLTLARFDLCTVALVLGFAQLLDDLGI